MAPAHVWKHSVVPKSAASNTLGNEPVIARSVKERLRHTSNIQVLPKPAKMQVREPEEEAVALGNLDSSDCFLCARMGMSKKT